MSADVQAGCEPLTLPGSGDNASVHVVLVHGFTGNPRATRPMAERLHDLGYSVDAVRLPGHGTTVADFRTTRYADYRRTVDDAVLTARETATHVVLVGHSMGGTLALDVASARPNDVDAVVAINPQIRDPEQLIARLAPLLQFVLPVVPRDVAGLPTDDMAMPGVTEGAYGQVSAKAAQSLIGELPGIRAQLAVGNAPLLLITSPDDHTVPAKNSDTVAELWGGEVSRVTASRSYHVPQLDWDRDLVETAVIDFVSSSTGG